MLIFDIIKAFTSVIALALTSLIVHI